MTLSKASKKKPKRCKAVKNEPLGHFLNILPFSSVMKIETERNLKTFQIDNLAVKTALKQVNLHVKRAETSADADDIHFQAILVTIIVANQFFLPPEHFAKIPLGFSCHWGSLNVILLHISTSFEC